MAFSSFPRLGLAALQFGPYRFGTAFQQRSRLHIADHTVWANSILWETESRDNESISPFDTRLDRFPRFG